MSSQKSRSLAVHEVLGGVGRGEALVDELVFVLEVARVILEVVLLATEELVDLGLPGGVERLALGLRTVTAVILVAEILVRVGHIFAGVDVEVSLLLVLNLEEAGLGLISILAEVSLHDGAVDASGLLHQGTLVDVRDEEAGERLSAELHALEGTDSGDSLHAEPETDTPRHEVVACHGAVQRRHSFSVSDSHVVRDEVAGVAVGVDERVVPLKTIILNHEFSEPGTSRKLEDATEVAHGVNLVQHLCFLKF